MKNFTITAAAVLAMTAAGFTTSLRSLAHDAGIKVGTAAGSDLYGGVEAYTSLVKNEFEVLVAQKEFGFCAIRPTEGDYDWRAADRLVAFVEANNMSLRAEGLITGTVPKWFSEREWTRAELLDALKGHVYSVMSRYRARVLEWDVVSDAFYIDWENARIRYVENIWYTNIGPEYIDSVFVWAKKANPHGFLFYKDSDIISWNIKSNFLCTWARLKGAEIPVDGISFGVSNEELSAWGNIYDWKENIKRFTDLGLLVSITQAGQTVVSDSDAEESPDTGFRSEILASLLNVCAENSRCGTFTPAGLFDQDYKPNAAYYMIQRALAYAPSVTALDQDQTGVLAPAPVLQAASVMGFDAMGRAVKNALPVVRLYR